MNHYDRKALRNAQDIDKLADLIRAPFLALIRLFGRVFNA